MNRAHACRGGVAAALTLLLAAACGCPLQIEAPPADPPDDAYLLPFAAGQHFVLAQGNFGLLGVGSHAGQYALDFAMPEGTPILAARRGTVLATRADCPDVQCPFEPERCCGNFVRVRHDDNTVAVYLHLLPGGVCVTPGQPVARGDVLGLSGNTGRSMGPHLHMAVFAPEGQPGEGSLGASRNRTLEIRFADVPGGVPQFLQLCTSRNAPRTACEN